MRFALHLYAFAVFTCATPLAATAAGLQGLVPSYSRDPSICKKVFAKARAISGCRAYDVVCPGKTDSSVENGAFDANGYVGTNAYGYSEISLLKKKSPPNDESTLPAGDAEADEIADTLPEGVVLLFVGRFRGDNYPRLLETWKVDQSRLEDVLEVPLPPMDVSDQQKSSQRNASEFAVVLTAGELLSEQWLPLVAIDGKAYTVERECSGRWAYGGYYACNRIIKLTFKRIEAIGKSSAYCQLSLPRRKPALLKSK